MHNAGMTKDEMKQFAKRRQEIRRLAAKGVPHPEIARKFGMKNRQRVWQIVNGK